MKRFAFTIIELLIVISIIGLLIAAAAVGFQNAERTSRDAQRISDGLNLAKMFDEYAVVNNGQYPQPNTNTNSNDQCGGAPSQFYVTTPCFNSSNPTLTSGLDLSLFTNNTLPSDPRPATSFTNSYLKPSTYVYSTEYSHPSPPTNAEDYAARMGTVYSIELYLENPQPADDTTLFELTDTTAPTFTHSITGISPINGISSTSNYDTSANRYQYFINGKVCQTSASINNCYN